MIPTDAKSVGHRRNRRWLDTSSNASAAQDFGADKPVYDSVRVLVAAPERILITDGEINTRKSPHARAA